MTIRSQFAALRARLVRDRGLRPEKRSSSLISMANSLSVIARALQVIVLREYRVDLSAPEPSRADLARAVFEPLYSSNESEAVREEQERIAKLELEASVADAAESPGRAIAMQFSRSRAKGSDFGEDIEELSKQERSWLAELGTGADSSQDDEPGGSEF